MIRYLCFAAVVLLLASCSERSKPKVDPVGVWENRTIWDNNRITLTIRPDSTMLFKVEKSFCPGTKFFVAIGDWHIENDSLLIMEPVTDGRHYEIRDLFPELMQTKLDSNNVIALDISAKLIIADSSLYDISSEGKRVPEHSYGKISE
jgi:hypothetical protein